MPWYLVLDGKKQEKDEDIFDQMVQALNPETVQEPPIQTSTRWKPDGTYDSKPLDPNCGHTISSKSILSKHRQTNICMRNRCQCWNPFFLNNNHFFIENVFMLKSNPNPKNSNRQPEPKKLLKEILPYILRRKWQRIQGWNIQQKVLILKINPATNPINHNILNKQWKLKNYLKKHPLIIIWNIL